jgi:hypothetical protein
VAREDIPARSRGSADHRTSRRVHGAFDSPEHVVTAGVGQYRAAQSVRDVFISNLAVHTGTIDQVKLSAELRNDITSFGVLGYHPEYAALIRKMTCDGHEVDSATLAVIKAVPEGGVISTRRVGTTADVLLHNLAHQAMWFYCFRMGCAHLANKGFLDTKDKNGNFAAKYKQVQEYCNVRLLPSDKVVTPKETPKASPYKAKAPWSPGPRGGRGGDRFSGYKRSRENSRERHRSRSRSPRRRSHSPERDAALCTKCGESKHDGRCSRSQLSPAAQEALRKAFSKGN